MTRRNLAMFVAIIVALAFLVFLVLTSISETSAGGGHTMPDGTTMQGDSMDERRTSP